MNAKRDASYAIFHFCSDFFFFVAGNFGLGNLPAQFTTMNASGIILLSEASPFSQEALPRIALIDGVRDKTSSIMLSESASPVPEGYESKGGILVRSGGLIAVATDADIARFA